MDYAFLCDLDKRQHPYYLIYNILVKGSVDELLQALLSYVLKEMNSKYGMSYAVVDVPHIGAPSWENIIKNRAIGFTTEKIIGGKLLVANLPKNFFLDPIDFSTFLSFTPIQKVSKL